MSAEFIRGLLVIDLTAIKMADDKAWICIAITTAIFAGVGRTIYNERKMPPRRFKTGLLALIVMALGVISCFAATFARGDAYITYPQGEGVVYFRRVLAFKSDQKKYEAHTKQMTAEELISEGWEVHWGLSEIAGEKYFWLKIGLAVSIVGWLTAGIFMIWMLWNLRLPENLKGGQVASAVEPVTEGISEIVNSSNQSQPDQKIDGVVRPQG